MRLNLLKQLPLPQPKAILNLAAWMALCLFPTQGQATADAFQGLTEKALSWPETRIIMAQHCFECHGGFLTEGGLDLLAQRDESSIEAAPEQWEAVVHALRNHYMPPLEGRNLPSARRDALISDIEQRLIALAGDEVPPPASLRRLNRTEFGNTLRDLLFLELDLEDSLPPDDSGYGFDNIADVMTISPLLLEKYLDAAAAAGELAVPSATGPYTLQFGGMDFVGKNGRSELNGRHVYTSGFENAAILKLNLPTPGVYQAKLYLAAQQAGKDLAGAKVFWNKKEEANFTVSATSAESPDVFDITLVAKKAGPAELRIALTKDYYKDDAPEGEPNDRNLIVAGVDWTGLEQSEEDLFTEFLRTYFGGAPEELGSKKIREGIWRFTSRAYRRPALKAETDSLWKVYHDALTSEGGSPRMGLRAVVDATLASPNFLFRQESAAVTNDFVLATWLSYFLWSTLPDNRLFDLARKGQLSENLESEVLRMLKDPKASALTENFAAQWWQFRDLSTIRPNKAAYPRFNRALRRSMERETEMFFNDLVRNDRSILRILDADYTFADKRLIQFYGLDEKPGRGFRRVSLAETARRGVWSQASVLTVTSHGNRTSPVLRGKWILENLVGLSPPPPPANIPSLTSPENNPTPTDLLSRLAQHRSNPDCASCHAIMDPFGLVLETYDGIGDWRPDEQRAEVRPETLFDGTTVENPLQLAAYLSEVRRDDFVANFAKKLVTYANGRGTTWRDRAALTNIATETAQQDYRFSALVLAIVKYYAPGIIQTKMVGDTAWTDAPASDTTSPDPG